MPFTDFRLVRRVRQGDKAAFGTLYDRHGPKVYNLLRRLSANAAAADDLTQETFLAAYHSLASWRGVGSISGWLCGIAVRSWRNHRRRSAPEESLAEMEDDADPAVIYLQDEDREALSDAIDRLPTICREAFALVYVEEMSYKDVARYLDIPVGTVQSRLSRAKAMLKSRLAHRLDTADPRLEKGANTHVI